MAVPQEPALAPTATARRVMLLSFDGLGADALARQTNLPAFERLAREGASARILNVDPTLTAPTHAAILTGAEPQRTGIVSNRFHLDGTPPEKVTRGMEVESDVETLVEAARRQGKRVGVVSFPSVDNRTPRRGADFGLAWSYPLAPARLVELTRADFKREWVPPTWSERPQRRRSYSPIMRARVEWGVPRRNARGDVHVRTDVDVVAYDTTNDGKANYDTYTVETSDEELATDARGWFSISRDSANGLHASWSKFLETTPSLRVKIYWGSISRTEAWPASFRSLVEREAGVWPGEPEEDVPVDSATFEEQMERLAAFYTRAQLAAIAHMPFDLLLAYQPQIDLASHNFLATPDGERVIRTAFVAADRAVAAFADALEPEDALVVVGDHGLVPTVRQVDLNAMLPSHWRAYTSGAHGQLYRFSGADDSDAVVTLLNGSGLFERIEKKSANSHPHTGDIVAWALPGIGLSTDGVSRGQHGGLNTHRELHPPLFAIGAGVKPGAVGEVRQTRIARYVAGLLGIQPPQAAE